MMSRNPLGMTAPPKAADSLVEMAALDSILTWQLGQAKATASFSD